MTATPFILVQKHGTLAPLGLVPNHWKRNYNHGISQAEATMAETALL